MIKFQHEEIWKCDQQRESRKLEQMKPSIYF